MEERLAEVGLDVDLSLHLRLGALVLARMLGLCMPLPFLGGNLVPARVRFGIPLAITLFIYPFMLQGVDPAAVPAMGLHLLLELAKEVLIGFCLGFIIAMPFHALSAAGDFMDRQRGIMFAQVADPLTGGQTSPLGQLYQLLFVVVFLSVGGMRIVLGAVADSYEAFPLLAPPPLLHGAAPAVEVFIAHSALIFTIGVQFVAPVVVAMFLTDVTLGLVNRAAPNVQVFFLGMPLKALGGLVIVFVTLGFAHGFFAHLMARMGVDVRRALEAMGAS